MMRQLLVALLLTGCTTVPDTGDKAAIRAVMDSYAAAWLAGDQEGVLRTLTDDAVIMPHHGDDPVSGKAALRTHWWPPGAAPVVVTVFDIDPAEITTDKRMAYARGRFSLTFVFRQDGRTVSAANEGNFMMVFRRESNRWRIARYIWNDPVARLD